LLDLGAQPLDVDIQGLGVADIIGTPDAVDELTAGEHTAGVAQEVFQQVEFLQRHVDRLSVDGDGVAVHIHAHTSNLEGLVVEVLLGGLGLGVRPATQYRAAAGDDLAGAGRLGHISNGTGVHTNNLADVGATRRHHDHRPAGYDAQFPA